MKKILIPTVVILLVLATLWSASTFFGKHIGVTFSQSVRLESRLKDTYTVYTNVWIYPWYGGVGSIEHQTSVSDVLYCDIKKVKYDQKKIVYPIYLSIKKSYRRPSHVCP